MHECALAVSFYLSGSDVLGTSPDRRGELCASRVLYP